MKYVYLDSYAQAEKLSIKPVDSIISSIVDVDQCRKGNYVIVGYSQGHTFLMKDTLTDQADKTFICSFNSDNGRYNIEVHAKNLIVAKMILKHDYIAGTEFMIYQQPDLKLVTNSFLVIGKKS